MLHLRRRRVVMLKRVGRVAFACIVFFLFFFQSGLLFTFSKRLCSVVGSVEVKFFMFDS